MKIYESIEDIINVPWLTLENTITEDEHCQVIAILPNGSYVQTGLYEWEDGSYHDEPDPYFSQQVETLA